MKAKADDQELNQVRKSSRPISAVDRQHPDNVLTHAEALAMVATLRMQLSQTQKRVATYVLIDR